MLNTRPTELKFFNGIKGIGFLLVVIGIFTNNLGHEQIQIAKVAAVLNIYSIYLVEDQLLTILFLSYLFAIDAFLFIGGFLLGYYFPRKYLK